MKKFTEREVDIVNLSFFLYAWGKKPKWKKLLPPLHKKSFFQKEKKENDYHQEEYHQGYLGCYRCCGYRHGYVDLNNIGVTFCTGNYNLITDVLKNEWGFKGMVITDYMWTSAAMCEQILFAGGDLMLQTVSVTISSRKTNETKAQLQRAAKNVLWTVAHSNAMNGYGVGTEVKSPFPVYEIIV